MDTKSINATLASVPQTERKYMASYRFKSDPPDMGRARGRHIAVPFPVTDAGRDEIILKTIAGWEGVPKDQVILIKSRQIFGR